MMRRQDALSIGKRTFGVVAGAWLVPCPALAMTGISSVAGLYQLVMAFVIPLVLLVGASLFGARKAGWRWPRDGWRVVLLLLASLVGAVLLTLPFGWLMFG